MTASPDTDEPRGAPPWKRWVFPALLIAAGLAVYWNALPASFQFDDHYFIVLHNFPGAFTTTGHLHGVDSQFYYLPAVDQSTGQRLFLSQISLHDRTTICEGAFPGGR